MNWLDLALIVFVSLFVLGGWRKGLIKGVFEIAGLAAAIILGGRFSPQLSTLLLSQDVVSLSVPVAEIAAFIIIFIAILVVFSILAHLIKLLARIILLGWLDRFGGVLLGLVEGLIFSSLLLTLLTFFPIYPRLNRALDESSLARPVQTITPRIFGALQGRYPYFERFRHRQPGGVVLISPDTGAALSDSDET
jgi:membrane protein required for colicin V production